MTQNLEETTGALNRGLLSQGTPALETARVLAEAVSLYEASGFQSAQKDPEAKRCDLVMERKL